MTDMTLLTPSHSFPLPLPYEKSSRNFTFSSSEHFSTNSGLSKSASSMDPSASRPMSNGERSSAALLSPPINTFKAPRTTRRNKRPVEQTSASEDEDSAPATSEDEVEDPDSDIPSYTRSFRPFSYHSTPYLEVSQVPKPSDIPRPQPPLFRPKTFWRNTRRSALTGPSYSPASYLVRRSTFIAAGLELDKPHADLSALGVELRIGRVVLVPSFALPL